MKAKLQSSLSLSIALIAGGIVLASCSPAARHAANRNTSPSAKTIGAELTVSKGSTQLVFTDEDFRQRLHLVAVEVDDPVYAKRKRYAGYWLAEIFELAGIQSDAKSIWIFSALDGYQGRITVADVINSTAKPFVAVRDLDASEGWEKIEQGKEWLSPGPFYLVWQTQTNAHAGLKLPWPYQLAAIRVQDANEAQQRLFPKTGDASEPVARGFEIFRQSCLSCHSLNLEGGVLGPELNIPKNILEYREAKILKEFITNPSSFRAKSKMPAFGSSLSSQSLDDLLAYLAWIGQHKVPAD